MDKDLSAPDPSTILNLLVCFLGKPISSGKLTIYILTRHFADFTRNIYVASAEAEPRAN